MDVLRRDRMEEKTMNVKGMHCSACEVLVGEALLEKGVNAEASHKDGTIKVTYDSSTTSIDAIKRIIKEEGYVVV